MIRYSKLEDFRKRFITERLSLSAVIAFVLVVGCVYLFAVVTESWMEQDYLYRVDQGVYYLVANYLQPVHVAIAQVITYLGDFLVALAISIALAVYFYWRHWWRDLASLVLVMGGGQALIYTLKGIFARVRPQGPLTDALTVAESFPSGHTATATLLYGIILVLVFRHTRRPAVRVVATVVCVALILGIGLSRLALSVHWMSDVLGGWLIGLAWLICAVQIVWFSMKGTADSGRQTAVYDA